jgi:hypothetical protein
MPLSTRFGTIDDCYLFVVLATKRLDDFRIVSDMMLMFRPTKTTWKATFFRLRQHIERTLLKFCLLLAHG